VPRLVPTRPGHSRKSDQREPDRGPERGAADHIKRVVHACIDTRERDQRRQGDQQGAGTAAARGGGENDGASKARAGVSGREGVTVRQRHERLDLGEAQRRPRPPDRSSQPCAGQTSGQIGRTHPDKQRRPAPEQGEDERKRKPDRATVAQPGEHHRERVEQTEAVRRNGPLQRLVEADQSGSTCRARSTRRRGSSGRPKNALAPSERASCSSTSSSELNISTGGIPSP